MGAGIGAVADAVAVDIQVAAPFFLTVVQVVGGQHLAAVVAAAVVPGERRADMVVHAEIEIAHDDHRGLQPFGEIEGVGGQLETFPGVAGKEQDMFGVAVRGIGAGQEVGLLGPGGHAGARAGPLHIDEHRRNLGEIGEAQELAHQRDAGAGGGGKGPGAVPGGADDDAERRQFVFGLEDRHLAPAGVLFHPEHLPRIFQRPRRWRWTG